jgi:hypothetical protein
MKILQRLYFGAGVFFFLVLIAWCCQGVLSQSVWDSSNPFEILAQSRRADQLAHELDVQRQILWRHMEYKRSLVAEMIAGQRSLWQAVRLLQEQDAFTPRFLKELRLLYPAASDNEAVGRNLILFARNILNDDPRQATVIARLEAELAQGPRELLVHGPGPRQPAD